MRLEFDFFFFPESFNGLSSGDYGTRKFENVCKKSHYHWSRFYVAVDSFLLSALAGFLACFCLRAVSTATPIGSRCPASSEVLTKERCCLRFKRMQQSWDMEDKRVELPAERPYSLNLDLETSHRYHDYLHIAAADSENEETDNYFSTAEEKTYDATPDSGIHDVLSVDPEQRAKYEEDWKAELFKTEEEIATLRQVLCAKVRYAQELKRKLGITPWKELKEDVEQSFKSIQEAPGIKEVGGKIVEWNSAITSAPIFPGIFSSSAYQKTSQTLKTAGMKTSTALAGFGSSMTKKIGEVKNSPTYRSFEQRMESAYASVKSKVNNTRSTSLYSFEDALNNSDHRSAGFSSAAATPTISEKSPLP